MKNEYLRGFLVLVCILMVGLLTYVSIVQAREVSEYSITFFASTAALLIGYGIGVEIER